MRLNRVLAAGVAVAALLGLPGAQAAPTLGAPFAADYTVTNLGSITNLPTNYGGLTFLNDSTILIGGAANQPGGKIYKVTVTRGAGGHITSLGAATAYGDMGSFNDGGIAFGPDGVLFTSRYPANGLGQTKPGSTIEDKIIDLAAMGVARSHAAFAIVPAGFAGAGLIKLVSYIGGQFYSASLTPDGLGTFDLTGLAQVDVDPIAAGMQSLVGGPEGFVYIDGSNDGFGGTDSMLVSEYAAGTVGAYEIDANGNPIAGTRRDFLVGLSGAEGATIDPVTGDFLFSTFGSGNEVFRISGFTAPPRCGVPGTPPCDPTVPLPGSLPLMLLALTSAGWVVRRRSATR